MEQLETFGDISKVFCIYGCVLWEWSCRWDIIYIKYISLFYCLIIQIQDVDVVIQQKGQNNYCKSIKIYFTYINNFKHIQTNQPYASA